MSVIRKNRKSAKEMLEIQRVENTVDYVMKKLKEEEEVGEYFYMLFTVRVNGIERNNE